MIVTQQAVSNGSLWRGMNLNHADLVAIRPLALAILTAYGVTTQRLPATADEQLAQIQALRDWVNRTFIHPVAYFHPDGSTVWTEVLPAGATWAQFNATMNGGTRVQDAFNYWSQSQFRSKVMLDKMLGTLQADGTRADDGLMTPQAPGSVFHRIKSLDTYMAPACTFEQTALQGLAASIGYQSALIGTNSHDPSACFIPALGDWVLSDANYNEMPTLNGRPLSPLGLHALALAGRLGEIGYVDYAPPGKAQFPVRSTPESRYINHARSMNKLPWTSLIVHTDNLLTEANPTRESRVVSTSQNLEAPATTWAQVTPESAFPMLGTGVQSVKQAGGVTVVNLSATWPDAVKYEASFDGAPYTQTSDSRLLLPPGSRVVTVRAVDATGAYGTALVMQ